MNLSKSAALWSGSRFAGADGRETLARHICSQAEENRKEREERRGEERRGKHSKTKSDRNTPHSVKEIKKKAFGVFVCFYLV